MQKIRIIVMDNSNRREAIIVNSKNPGLELGGAPTPTKIVLEMKMFIRFVEH